MVMACVGVAKAEDKIEGTVGADVVTRYIWRGQALGDAAVQRAARVLLRCRAAVCCVEQFGETNRGNLQLRALAEAHSLLRTPEEEL